jgi:hypothetical protein
VERSSDPVPGRKLHPLKSSAFHGGLFRQLSNYPLLQSQPTVDNSVFNTDMKRHRASKVSISTACVFALALVTFTPVPLLGQGCPQASETGPHSPSEVRILEGRLVFHDAIREWFELKLDTPQCGQASIELVRVSLDDRRPLEILRGCRVRSSGTIGFSGTGYYSLEMNQDVVEIGPVGTCDTQLPLPDYADAKPEPTVGKYRVDMQVDYEPGDHPIIFRVSNAGKNLQPWQAYASYTLTGGFVLYGHCAEGFVVDKVFGTAQAKPSHFDEPRSSDDTASFDPESAAASCKKNLHVGYTCVRQP